MRMHTRERACAFDQIYPTHILGNDSTPVAVTSAEVSDHDRVRVLLSTGNPTLYSTAVGRAPFNISPSLINRRILIPCIFIISSARVYNANEIYESAHEPKTAWLIPDTQVSSKHRARASAVMASITIPGGVLISRKELTVQSMAV